MLPCRPPSTRNEAAIPKGCCSFAQAHTSGPLAVPMRCEMDTTEILCERNQSLLLEFSKRTVDRILSRPWILVPRAVIRAYMDANVRKESEKDRLIIEKTALAVISGIDPDDVDIDALFEETKIVDRKFMHSLIAQPFSLRVSFDSIAHVRKQRIRLLTNSVHSLLQGWNDSTSLEQRVKQSFPEQEFRQRLTEDLHLYNLETRIVSKSLRFPSLLNPAVRRLSEALFEIMEDISRLMVSECAQIYYGEVHHV
jgi:hypothetical protein